MGSVHRLTVQLESRPENDFNDWPVGVGPVGVRRLPGSSIVGWCHRGVRPAAEAVRCYLPRGRGSRILRSGNALAVSPSTCWSWSFGWWCRPPSSRVETAGRAAVASCSVATPASVWPFPASSWRPLVSSRIVPTPPSSPTARHSASRQPIRLMSIKKRINFIDSTKTRI